MANGRCCILGQLCGGFERGATRLGLWGQSIELGFMLEWQPGRSEAWWKKRWKWLRTLGSLRLLHE
jgi:hypothetical protein